MKLVASTTLQFPEIEPATVDDVRLAEAEK